jgi:hypothetical protein
MKSALPIGGVSPAILVWLTVSSGLRHAEA